MEADVVGFKAFTVFWGWDAIYVCNAMHTSMVLTETRPGKPKSLPITAISCDRSRTL